MPVMKGIAFEDVAPDGLLKARAELAFRHLQEPYFQWDRISRVNFEAFPGDAIGRTINGLTLLSQALHQPEPASLKEIMRRVPQLANSDGYLGPKLPESRANEDTLAGHNGYTYGLVEYALWTQDPAAKESLRRMVANLFVPLRAAIVGYRETSEAKVDWHLSGGDVGQLFTALDGMTRAYALVPSPEFKATIETAIERYRKLDLVGLNAQTHAMLSAATGILRWHEMHHRPEDLAFAEVLYKQYRALAMTETCENYNWFNRPTWTEACAVSDSFILAVNLWRLTGRASYLEDAHLILFNGLLPGQLPNGGFGTGPCVGPATGVSRTKTHSEAPFCCSMRGGEALARAIQYSYFLDRDTVRLPFYEECVATLRFAAGNCKVRQKTGYPHQGQVRLEVMESQVNRETKWLFFVPSWAVPGSLEIRVNGKKVEPSLADSFAGITVQPVAGTVVEVTFQQERGLRPAVQAGQGSGSSRYFSGPLLLGSATDKATEPLVPILDLLGPGGSGGEPYVYFPGAKSQPVTNAPAARKAPNLAETAQLFRRDRQPEPLPAEVGKLFDALKQDRTLAICAFAWSGPQKVRQVVLQWPEAGAMPKPEAIVLRWSAAGACHTAAQPGIIGNGRQWVYTLGKAQEGAVVDGLVLAGKSAEGIPDGLVIPDVEVLGMPGSSATGETPAAADPAGILRKPIPDKLVVLTFDDGPASHYTVVFPILKELGFKGSFYISDFASFQSRKDWYMTWQQMKEMADAGMEIGNHTTGHVGAAAIGDFLSMEAALITNNVPKPVTEAWPGGHSNPQTFADLAANGYLFGRGVYFRPYRPTIDNSLDIPSAAADNMADFVKLVRQAAGGKIVVLLYHGVPDIEHPFCSLDPGLFRGQMQYLKDNHYKVIALRDLAEYIDPAKGAALPPTSRDYKETGPAVLASEEVPALEIPAVGPPITPEKSRDGSAVRGR